MEYLVGNCYSDFINLREGQTFSFDGEKAQIVILRKNLDEDLINIIKNNEIFFQIFVKEEIIFILVKIDNLKWIDMPYATSLTSYPALPDDLKGYECEIILADPLSGKLHVKRLENFSIGLSKALFWATCKQIRTPIKDIQRKINKVHACFSSDEMARLSLGKN